MVDNKPSIINHQTSTIKHQPSIINYQLSIIHVFQPQVHSNTDDHNCSYC